MYALGKLPAREDGVLFQFASYFSKPDLPKPPAVFGVWQHFWNVHSFQNENIGNCVMAGAANETASWFHDIGKWVSFTDENVISDHTVLTGYDPIRNYDPGADMSVAAEYRRKTGIVDHNGIRHKIDAYVKLPKKDFDSLKIAMYLFGAAAIGFLMPDYGMEDFANNTPWNAKKYKKIIGGHYVPGVGIDADGDIVVITWGKYQKMTRKFYEKFSDEACGYFSFERLLNRTSPEGFQAEKLISDLKTLKTPFGGYEYFGIPLDNGI
jgi:hypothetical protein